MSGDKPWILSRRLQRPIVTNLTYNTGGAIAPTTLRGCSPMQPTLPLETLRTAWHSQQTSLSYTLRVAPTGILSERPIIVVATFKLLSPPSPTQLPLMELVLPLTMFFWRWLMAGLGTVKRLNDCLTWRCPRWNGHGSAMSNCISFATRPRLSWQQSGSRSTDIRSSVRGAVGAWTVQLQHITTFVQEKAFNAAVTGTLCREVLSERAWFNCSGASGYTSLSDRSPTP